MVNAVILIFFDSLIAVLLHVMANFDAVRLDSSFLRFRLRLYDTASFVGHQNCSDISQATLSLALRCRIIHSDRSKFQYIPSFRTFETVKIIFTNPVKRNKHPLERLRCIGKFFLLSIITSTSPEVIEHRLG
jgi:hypothetical protein